MFFYVSGILNEAINNNGQIGKPQQKEKLKITQKQLDSVTVSENPITISELCSKIDSTIVSPNMKKLQATKVTSWLLKKEILYIEVDSFGKQRKSPTSVGEQIGITVEKRSGHKGDYLVNLYNKEAQQFVLDNLLQIIEEDGTLDAYVTSKPAGEIASELSSGQYKLAYIGETLAWEYLRNVGIDGAKPDIHISTITRNLLICLLKGVKMQELILKLWFLWIFLIVVAIYRLFKPTIKGWFGEKVISFYLRKLPGDKYKLINDVTLPTDNGTTQIDHIVVSPYGIFIVETKNYKGWISGGEKSSQWTQNIYGKKTSFLNPILQNFAHVKAVKALLSQYPSLIIIPIVAFSPECELKVKTTSHVVYYHRICEVISKYKDKVLSGKDVTSIVNILCNENLTSADVKKEHVRAVRNKKADFDKAVSSSKCPRCDGNLIKRSGKNGSFLGCSSFPKCRFTKQL